MSQNIDDCWPETFHYIITVSGRLARCHVLIMKAVEADWQTLLLFGTYCTIPVVEIAYRPDASFLSPLSQRKGTAVVIYSGPQQGRVGQVQALKLH